jgi:hypothetical protein
MSKYQIVQNIARKGERAPKEVKAKRSVNYLAIPFKEMKVGDCVIVKEREGSANVKACVKLGVKRALAILGLSQEGFIVDWTKDKTQVAVWRTK